MSTRSSLVLKHWNEPKEIHIYRELMDGKYYIETEDGRIAIPEEYAKLFAKVIENEELKGDNNE